MSHPVYAFAAVLKQPRREAGLTVLAAADATGYRNYERWESGQTRVGAQHLRRIAGAFAITDDLHLLLYGWLLDRLVPQPDEPPVSLGLSDIRRHLRDAPDTVFDLHEHKSLVVEPGQHVDLALLCLAARHAQGEVIVLSPCDRSPLPPRSEERLLAQLYGDVLTDGGLVVGRASLETGLTDHSRGLNLANIGPALASPDTYRAMADELDAIDPTSAEPLVLFAKGTAEDARRFADLLGYIRSQLRELLEAANETPPSNEDVEHLTAQVLAGKRRHVLRLVIRAARRGRLPELNRRLIDELRARRDRIRAEWRVAAERQMVADAQRADAADIFAALDALRSRPSA